MIRNTLFALLLIAAAIAVWLGFARFRGANEAAPAPAPATPTNAPVLAAAATPPVAYAPPRVDAGNPPPDYEDEDTRDPEQAKLEGIQRLDAKFMAERVVPEWAMEQEQKIAASFSPEALKASNAPVPLAHEASCRSTSCKITATYQSETDSQVGHLNLMAAIPNLERSVMGQLRGPDGKVQLVVYASVAPRSNLPPRPHR